MTRELATIGPILLGAVGIAFGQPSAPATTDSAQGKTPSVPPVVQKRKSNARLDIPESDFRFGYAPQNAQIVHVYWIRNAGPDTARITDVRPGCGCTKAPLKKQVLAPGDSTDIEMIFSTGRYSSKTVKSATIVTDAAQYAPYLTFSAHPTSLPDALKPFAFTPPRIALDSLQTLSGREEFTVVAKNTSSEPLALSLISAPTDWFSVELPAGAIAPGSEGTVRVRLNRPVADTILTKSFTLEASDSSATRWTIPVQKAMRTGPTPTSSAAH